MNGSTLRSGRNQGHVHVPFARPIRFDQHHGLQVPRTSLPADTGIVRDGPSRLLKNYFATPEIWNSRRPRTDSE